MTRPAGNPFATRYVQPGALPYLLPAGTDASGLLDALRTAGWWGQITGPHGAGKTTLLHTLAPLLSAAGRTLDWFTLHGGQRRLPPDVRDRSLAWNASVLVIADGYEQLSWFARRQLQRACRRAGCGLLVTSHTDVGLPTLYATRTSLPVACQLVARLLQDEPAALPDDVVAERFHACGGNVREFLFALYDVYEMRRHGRS